MTTDIFDGAIQKLKDEPEYSKIINGNDKMELIQNLYQEKIVKKLDLKVFVGDINNTESVVGIII